MSFSNASGLKPVVTAVILNLKMVNFSKTKKPFSQILLIIMVIKENKNLRMFNNENRSSLFSNSRENNAEQPVLLSGQFLDI